MGSSRWHRMHSMVSGVRSTTSITPSMPRLAARVADDPAALPNVSGVPDDLELMAVYRLGYLPESAQRPAIDWSSHERRLPSQYVFRDSCRTPQRGWD